MMNVKSEMILRISKVKVLLCGVIVASVYVFFFIFTYSIQENNIKNDESIIEEKDRIQDYPNLQTSSMLVTSLQQQRCQIPKLNPFHPDITSFVDISKKFKNCDLKTFADINDEGRLVILRRTEVVSAKYAYIIRTGKNSQKITEWKQFYGNGIYDEVTLTSDFVKVSLKLNDGKEIVESHMFPVRSFEKHPRQTRDQAVNDVEKLNIVFIMIDSLSHSGAVRLLRKHYKYLQGDPDSVIFQGQTVVGDGTTSQLAAILVGDFESNLPEARKGFQNSGPVNRWPFIFNDYEQKGYVTMYSEDSPFSETFALRLNGFETMPTTKYFRNFWLGSKEMISRLQKNSAACIHQVMFRYLKRYLKQYTDVPSFAFLTTNLAHDGFLNAKLVDNDFQSFNQFLEDEKFRNNTIAIYFGDHGARSSAYRASMTGKLEERLPFMAFSFPRWFRHRYPGEFKIFRDNSKILTSHFDIHSTLRHLMYFNRPYTNNAKYGQSLFTDITKLNRTCWQAGVKEHWCPCIEYKPIGNHTDLAKSLAVHLVNTINEKLHASKKTKELCSLVKLNQISRVQQLKTNDKVKSFVDSYRKGCDGCGVKLNQNKQYTSDSYEVVIKTEPGGALFEANAIINRVTKGININNDISRINMYKNQPHCIVENYPHLRSFCYCKEQ